MFHYLALGAAILLGVVGQLSLKGGALQAGTLTQQLMHPFTIMGFGVYVASGLLYAISLKSIPVSLAFPSVAASYIVVAIAAHLLWQEPFGVRQGLGVALIGGGLILLHFR